MDQHTEARTFQVASEYRESPFAPKALEAIAWSYYGMKQYARAMVIYRAMTLYPTAPEAEVVSTAGVSFSSTSRRVRMRWLLRNSFAGFLRGMGG